MWNNLIKLLKNKWENNILVLVWIFGLIKWKLGKILTIYKWEVIDPKKITDIRENWLIMIIFFCPVPFKIVADEKTSVYVFSEFSDKKIMLN